MSNPAVMIAFGAWSQLYTDLYEANHQGRHARAKTLISQILNNDHGALHARSAKLNTIIGERVSVLPPDTRHVDYEVIPLMVASTDVSFVVSKPAINLGGVPRPKFRNRCVS